MFTVHAVSGHVDGTSLNELEFQSRNSKGAFSFGSSYLEIGNYDLRLLVKYSILIHFIVAFIFNVIYFSIYIY